MAPNSRKIYFGITKPNMGGAQRYVFDLSKYAHETGQQVMVITGRTTGVDSALIDKLTAEGIPVHELPGLGRDLSPLEDVRSFLKLWRILEEDRPDVFHINSSKMGGLGALAARLARIKKIIFTAHGFAFNEDRPEYQKLIIKFFVWITILLSHKTICVSDKLKKDVEHLPGTKGKLIVIKNGIEEFPLLSRGEARERLLPGLSKSNIVLGTLSELHPVKGLDIAIRGLKESGLDNITFVILGEGDEHFALQNLIDSLELSDRVFLKGYTPEAREYILAFDIFTLTSRSEGLPYALLEAGMAKLPVIATAVGGIPEIIRDHSTGILIPPENTTSFSSALKRLNSDKKLREELGDNLYQFVRVNFNREVMLEDTLNLF